MKTIVAAQSSKLDHTVVWIDGVEVELSFKNPNPFSMCGGVINTNSGFSFTKDMLLEIASKMGDNSKLRVCGTNKGFTKDELKQIT